MNYPQHKPRFNPLWILGKSGTYAILILGLVATLLPFFYISISSFKNEAELRKTPPTFLPVEPTTKHYTTILTDKDIPLGRILGNSIFVAIARVAITLFTSSFAGMTRTCTFASRPSLIQ